MKKNIFSTLVVIGLFGGVSSSVMGSELIPPCSNKGLCATFAPTGLPVFFIVGLFTVGPVEVTMDKKANEAVVAAQEPAFMVLNNQVDAKENPLFKNAVAELKKNNPKIQDSGDQEMASVIMQIGDQLQ